jgi:hypothetical protein
LALRSAGFGESTCAHLPTGGELHRWLERCWWRAIQVERLALSVVVDGSVQPIGVPEWWTGAPWQHETPQLFDAENVQIEAAAPGRIKRIVLSYDQDRQADEIEDVEAPQYAGVQLLRGQQWIETLGHVKGSGT